MTLLGTSSACHAMVREDLSPKHLPPLVPKSAGRLCQLMLRLLVAPTLHLGDWTPASDYTHRSPPDEYCAHSSAIAADAESPIGD